LCFVLGPRQFHVQICKGRVAQHPVFLVCILTDGAPREARHQYGKKENSSLAIVFGKDCPPNGVTKVRRLGSLCVEPLEHCFRRTFRSFLDVVPAR